MAIAVCGMMDERDVGLKLLKDRIDARGFKALVVDFSIGTVTALNPVIGYERATELAREAMASGRGILELVREKRVLTDAQLAQVLDPAAMTGQGRPA